ncbi:MAG: hypothetical protein JXB48_05400 [Candidatus Latescibacteria bacterium]|nr:hypothetical protein [Candidatus Latescibacterota bacterium]
MKNFIKNFIKNFMVAGLMSYCFTASLAFGAVSISVTVTEPVGIPRTGEGIHSGIPLEQGAVKSVDELVLVDGNGNPVPVQFEVLSQWQDGSLRWVLLNFLESLNSGQTKTYELRARGKNESIPVPQSVTITDVNDVFTVNTGSVMFDIPIYSSSVLANIRRKDASGNWVTVSTKGLEAVIQRTGVKGFRSHVENCTVESAGPLRSVIKIEGHHLLWDHTVEQFDPAGISTFQFIVRVFCYAGSDKITLQYTFINDNRDNRIRPNERYHVYAMEELADYKWVNGHWVERPKSIKFREQELLDDDYGQLNVGEIKLRLTMDDDFKKYSFGVVNDKPVTGTIDGTVALEQTGPVYSYDTFTKEMPYPHIPFKAVVIHDKNQPVKECEKADGWVTLSGQKNSIFFGSKYFWQYHPKIFALNKNMLEFHVWSKLEDIPDPEIGFAKTHEITIQFGDASEKFDTGALMAGLNKPLRAVTTPEHYMETGVFGTYLPANYELFGNAEEYLLISAENSDKTRGDKNIYGVRNFGDEPGIRYVPIYYNQEYDTLLAATLQFARTGKRIYYDESDILAWHFMDVDVLHASNSPLNEGGQHMHFTDHAKGETHAGHGTVEGLWYYYMLTGEPRAREVATGIADFFAKVAAWKNFLDFRDDEERTIGWALKALVPSYRATLNPRYKLAAQMVVEQAIAGQDPDTGNWDHPLYPNEDKHRPVCIGGKPWMVGIILQGMKHYYLEFGDPRVKDLILKAADWMIWSNYVYMTCTDREPGMCSTTHFDGLTYAWELSGKRYYLDEALKGFETSIVSLNKENAQQNTVRGNSLEGMANVMRIIEQQRNKIWKDDKPVLDPKSEKFVEEIRANSKFRAKPQKRY